MKMDLYRFVNEIEQKYDYYFIEDNGRIIVEAEEEFLTSDFEEIKADVSFIENLNCVQISPLELVISEI